MVNGADADPSVISCVVHDCKGFGIWVREQAGGTFERCAVVGNAGLGIFVLGDPVVRDCEVRDGKDAGILVGTRGKGTFERCAVVGNAGLGIFALGDPVVRDCQVFGNRDGGVIVAAGALGTITGCTVSLNTPDNWRVEAGAGGIRRDNRFDAPTARNALVSTLRRFFGLP